MAAMRWDQAFMCLVLFTGFAAEGACPNDGTPVIDLCGSTSFSGLGAYVDAAGMAAGLSTCSCSLISSTAQDFFFTAALLNQPRTCQYYDYNMLFTLENRTVTWPCDGTTDGYGYIYDRLEPKYPVIITINKTESGLIAAPPVDPGYCVILVSAAARPMNIICGNGTTTSTVETTTALGTTTETSATTGADGSTSEGLTSSTFTVTTSTQSDTSVTTTQAVTSATTTQPDTSTATTQPDTSATTQSETSATTTQSDTSTATTQSDTSAIATQSDTSASTTQSDSSATTQLDTSATTTQSDSSATTQLDTSATATQSDTSATTSLLSTSSSKETSTTPVSTTPGDVTTLAGDTTSLNNDTTAAVTGRGTTVTGEETTPDDASSLSLSSTGVTASLSTDSAGTTETSTATSTETIPGRFEQSGIPDTGVGVIVGGIFAGLTLFFLIATICYFCNRGARRKEKETEEEELDHHSVITSSTNLVGYPYRQPGDGYVYYIDTSAASHNDYIYLWS